MTSSFEKPKTKPSDLSMSTRSSSSPKRSDRKAASSSPPNPAPSTRTRTSVTLGPEQALVEGAAEDPVGVEVVAQLREPVPLGIQRTQLSSGVVELLAPVR